MGKIQKNFTAQDELANVDACAFFFLSGNRAFFDGMNSFASLRIRFKCPVDDGYFKLSLAEVRELWQSKYRAIAEAAGTRPPAHFYFDAGKTGGNDAFKAWEKS